MIWWCGKPERGGNIDAVDTEARDDLSALETARLTGVDKSTVVRWLQENKIAGWRTPGGHWRVPRTEVARLLNSKD